MRHVRTAAMREGIAAARVIYLIWSDVPPLTHKVYGAVYRAREFRFSPALPAHCVGIACKFNGSRVNRACINRALQRGVAVNLYAPDPQHVAVMTRDYGTRCSLTIDAVPPAPRS